MSVVRIVEASSAAELREVERLMRAYFASLAMDLAYQGVDAELATLPGKYARPLGAILLGWCDGVDASPVGVVAVRPLEFGAAGEPRVCEMKRLYVEPRARRSGLGDALVDRLLHEASAMGYASMKLDTDPTFSPAMRLYARHGFRPCARYNDDPHPETLYFERAL
ncbi:MAG: GNAT family N-acetyltransferase [Phycisphaerales bacterium]|nr:MAG: GNAT family N-acetyltransferase [Phycisphaerales bacterium]